MGIALGLVGFLLAAVALWGLRNTHFDMRARRATRRAGFVARDALLPDGARLHYAEGPDNGPALLLIHGQTGAWQSYESVLPKLSRRWHVFAVDVFGHGESSHDAERYTLRAIGEDLLWLIDRRLGGAAFVSGHSSGGLIAAYLAAYGGARVRGAVLEDPPVFSTEPGAFEKSFAYQDTYRVMHEYRQAERPEGWAAYYLRNCLWGRLFMPGAMPRLAAAAARQKQRHPGRPVRLWYLPPSVNQLFQFTDQYDFAFGERFYDFTWHSGIAHERMLADIRVPTVFLHAQEAYTPDGEILMAASSNAQARRAAALMEDARLTELKSNHLIHWYHPEVFLQAVEEMRSMAERKPSE